MCWVGEESASAKCERWPGAFGCRLCAGRCREGRRHIVVEGCSQGRRRREGLGFSSYLLGGVVGVVGVQRPWREGVVLEGGEGGEGGEDVPHLLFVGTPHCTSQSALRASTT